MSFIRWAPTFLGFPLGGWIAIQLVGTIDGPIAAGWAGLLAGAVIGTAQWLALRQAIGWRWLAGTAIGMATGSGIAAAVTGGATTLLALVGTGLITGAVVGAVQGVVLRRGLLVTFVWAATVSLSWAVGWIVTANVIVDAERGYVSFGASGAVVVTVMTGLVLRRILGPLPKRAVPEVAVRIVPRTREHVR